jgi:peptidoglycan/xylan/chitin deacetylase (PgdA/CDA1 family)
MKKPMTSLLKRLARATLPFLGWCGLPAFLRRGRRWFDRGETRLLILTYHRVCDPEPTEFRHQSETLGVAPDRFAAQIEYLAQHYPLFSLDNLAEYLTGAPAQMGEGIAVTFDDGYRDNLTVALPILLRHQVPATVFLATNFISDSPTLMWNDRLAP